MGRPQRIAYDDTPLHATPDLDARIGWLLATSRLYGGHADGAAFTRALSDHGAGPSRSLVSRWESGELPASFEGLAAYEAVLGLPQGRLTGLAGYLRADRPSVVPDPDLLDTLLDRAESGSADAQDWQRLGWHVAAFSHVHLRRDTWETLARRIVSTVPRAVGSAQLLYHNAVVDLAVVERARGFLVDAIEEYLDDPSAQVITSPFNLLERIPGERSGELVVAMVEEPRSQPVMVQAISMATVMLARGDLSEAQRSRLGMEVLRQWRQDPERTSKRLAELIAVLPEGLRAPLTDAASRSGQEHLEYAVTHAETLSTESERLSSDLAEAARARTPGEPVHGEDRMLPRLVREALYHRDADRRHQATLLLAASPFAPALGSELLALLEDSRGYDVRLAASWSMRYLVDGAHRMRIHRLHESRDELVAGPITLALGHLPFDEVTDQVLRAALTRELTNRSRASMFALGMTGSPSLAGLGRPGSPEWQGVAARWWERKGPSVRN